MTRGRILNIKEVMDLTSLSEATLRRWIGAQKFPSPLRLGERRVGWPEDAVSYWLQTRIGAEQCRDGDGADDLQD